MGIPFQGQPLPVIPYTHNEPDGYYIVIYLNYLPVPVLSNRCSVPGDFDTPEQRLGFYQDWRPWESCMSVESCWAYSGKGLKPLDTFIRMIVNNACCDGNILLSWGPKWNGEFDEAQKKRFFEIGDWLTPNGRAIYGTRGGPWKVSSWGGSTRRGATVWLHVLKWNGETLRLPSIPERRVQSARFLDGGTVLFQQTGGALEIRVPEAKQDTLDTIVELTFDKSVDGLPALDTGEGSIFNDPVTYGRIVSRQNEGKVNPVLMIDLGRDVSVTGVRVLRHTTTQDRAATLRLSVSLDGKDWKEVWTADRVAPQEEIPVSDFVAGAQVPGRKARYLRLETTPAPLHLRQVEVWGKE